MFHSTQSNKTKMKSDPAFAHVLDSDTIELFNRDTMYFRQSSWLNLIHEKRMEFQRAKYRFTIVFLSMIAMFAVLSLLFFVSAMISVNEDEINDDFHLDNQLFSAQSSSIETCKLIRPEDRIDCNPDPPISQKECENRGCCWNPSSKNILSSELNPESKVLPFLSTPSCYFPTDYNGYKIVGNNSKTSYTSIHLKRQRPSGFPKDIEDVLVEIFELDNQMVRVKFTDLKSQRYEVPIPELNLPEQPPTSSESLLYEIELNDSNLQVKRRSTGQPVFNVNLAILVYSDQLLQITNQLPSKFIYGLGEHREPFRKPANWKRYTMWNSDRAPVPSQPLYGSNPFYMVVEEHSNNQTEKTTPSTSGVFLFNSNAMDVLTSPSPAITFRTIGGILDFFIFFGPKPENVAQQYQRLLGLPIMPPYWSLGFHLSRFGYNNISNLNATFMRNQDQEIPQDVQWTDIDMFDSNNDFTYDKKRFQGMPDFINNILHKNGIKFIPMFDCGISAGETNAYHPYILGVEMDVFVKNSSGQTFIGKVWNTKSTVWPDFFHPNATEYWTQLFEEYHRTIEFDGAWIDMNEPSNFFDGQIDGCPKSELETPPYIPGMTDDSLTLRRKTLCMTARHYNDQLHYNFHNLYSLPEAIVTNSALKKVLNKRPFIISRATAPGHGHWASHWSGDIISDWDSMKWSIASLFNYNMFGVPMIGADICGFNGNTTEDLCARWHQLGAFYTFSRNHNTDNAVDQDAAALGPDVIMAAKNALQSRYAHLPYLYTLFYRVSREGGTVIRPLFFEFPDDENSYKIDTQFMWGSAMMIAPALLPNQTKIDIYFPKGKWFFTGSYSMIESQGQIVTTEALYKYPSVYYRSGSIIPIQKPKRTTEETRQGNFGLVVALENHNSKASGHLYWDSGDGLNTEELGQYNFYDFNYINNTLTIESKHLGYETKQIIDEIIFLGLDSKLPKSFSINGKTQFDSLVTDSHIDKGFIISNINLTLFDLNKNDPKIFHTIQIEE